MHMHIVVHTHACKVPPLTYALMKTCMPTLLSNVSTVRIASCLEDPRIPRSMPPIPWRCAGEVGGWDAWVLFFKKACIWLHDIYIYMLYIYISPLKSLNFANSVWIRDSEGLSAAWRLSGPGWFDIDLPREAVQGPPALCHGIHLVFLQTSGVDFQPLHLGCLLFRIGFFQCFSYEFGPVRHIQSLFQQLLLDFWDPMTIEGAPNHQVQSDDVHQPFVSWLEKSQ